MSKREVVITTIHCEGCPLYDNPQRVLDYPNCDNAKLGWVRCGAGNTVKRNTGACNLHPAKQQDKLVTAIPYDTVQPKLAEPEIKKPDNGLLGGLDFAARLKADIEAMARRVST